MCPPPVTGPHGDWLPHPPRVGRRDGQRPRGWVPLATGGTLPRWGCRCSPVPPRFQLPEPRGTTLGISCPDVASAGYGHHRDGGAGCWGLCTLGVTPAVVALPACACPPQKKARPVPAPRMGHPTADGPQGRPAVPRAMCRWDAVGRGGPRGTGGPDATWVTAWGRGHRRATARCRGGTAALAGDRCGKATAPAVTADRGPRRGPPPTGTPHPQGPPVLATPAPTGDPHPAPCAASMGLSPGEKVPGPKGAPPPPPVAPGVASPLPGLSRAGLPPRPPPAPRPMPIPGGHRRSLPAPGSSGRRCRSRRCPPVRWPRSRTPGGERGGGARPAREGSRIGANREGRAGPGEGTEGARGKSTGEGAPGTGGEQREAGGGRSRRPGPRRGSVSHQHQSETLLQLARLRHRHLARGEQTGSSRARR